MRSYAVALHVASHPARCIQDSSEEFSRGQAGLWSLVPGCITRCTYQQLYDDESDRGLHAEGGYKCNSTRLRMTVLARVFSLRGLQTQDAAWAQIHFLDLKWSCSWVSLPQAFFSSAHCAWF